MNFHQNGLGLKETLEILSRNKFLIILCLLISSFLGFGYFHFGPKKYRIGTKLLIYQNSKNKSLAGDWMAELEDFDNSNFVSNEMEILKSMRFRNLVLNSVDKRSKITEYQFRENLSVIRIKNTDIIEITFISDEPEQGILLLEELLCFYRENSSEKIRSSEKKTLDFLNSRVVELKSQIESVENLLSNFKEESNVSLSVELFAIELEKKLSANKVFEKEFLVSKNELLSTKENLNYLFLSPQLYGNLSNWYNEKKLELSRFRNITSEDHPEILIQEELLKKIISDLTFKINTDLRNIDSMILRNELEFSNLYNLWKKIPLLQKEINKILREKAIIEDLFIFLTRKKEETEINLASQFALFWVFDPPSNLLLVSPHPLKISALVLFFGIIFPSSILVAKKSLDTIVYTGKELSQLTEIPILGTLNLIKEKNKLVFNDKKHRVISEQFRMIRSNLSFVTSNNTPQVLLISSCISGEGKTFFSANFGLSLAFSGKKTIVIEFDLRSPKLKNYLNVEYLNKGVSHYLSGQCDVNQIIYPSQHHSNLFFIPAGPIPPNPGELMKQEKLKHLFEVLKSDFDYLILDSPPISLVADAFFLTDFADATIFIIRLRKTKTDHIRLIQELVPKSKIAKPSLVLNGNSDKSDYPDYYSYS